MHWLRRAIGGIAICALSFESGCLTTPTEPAVVLNELHADDDGVWIELLNHGGRTANLRYYGLRLDHPSALRDPTPVVVSLVNEGTLAPGERMLVVLGHPHGLLAPGGQTTRQIAFPDVATNDTQHVALISSDGAEIERALLLHVDTDESYGRSPDGAGTWQRSEPTPGAANGGSM